MIDDGFVVSCVLLFVFDFTIDQDSTVAFCVSIFVISANLFFERETENSNSRQKTSKSHASSLNPTLHSGGHAPPHRTAETPHLNLDWAACPARKLQRLWQQRKTT